MTARLRAALAAAPAAALTLLLGACATAPGPPPIESGLVGSYHFTLEGQGYTIHRLEPGENRFALRTADGRPGVRRQMARVVRLASGCQSLSLRETEPDWRAAEATGAICTKGQKRFRSSR